MAQRRGKARRGPDGLTPKQRAFVEAYLANGGNGTRAALSAYDCRNARSADGCARAALRDAKVQEVLGNFLGWSDVDAKAIASKLYEGLNAMKRASWGEVPDLATRHRYLVTVLGLLRE